MRVAPKVWIGVVVFVGYAALVVGIQAATGIDYTRWGDSARNLFLGAGLSLIVATVVLAIVTTLLGWWGPALRERHRARHRWPLIAPILLAVIAVVVLVASDWKAVSGAFLVAALVLVLVGFTEEIVARGLLLVALRSRLSEFWVWLITSVLFGVMHLSNSLLGQPLSATLPQVGFAFLVGTSFYIVRRCTGSLIPAMILHGLWDFAQFISGNGTPGAAAPFAQAFVFVVGALALVSVGFVIRGADERLGPRAQLTSTATRSR
ncbi:CPBP family intramembrane glutamic endopeptidase [Curtobacterium sp. VKM Ac-2884]|uniref:CPBP family intramembrane glutamic endopeptidase n=1 Tax=Curtobacterium sp. VKM Ac-2884 TaxID=2783818 RepID=UPI00188D95A4|nr:CPBP family intramembrane glutamic endopeptidase [Curtobacterium sp. VKM Ac-2884]MBF4603381.1 CPBP family intramembrane metalloprotease [Curtobacterium sp. VKM Ac-2884]